MKLQHGYSTLFTVLLSLALTGCFGGGGSSKSDAGSADRSAAAPQNEQGEPLDNTLELTSAFSVDAGTSTIFTDGGAAFPLEGKVINPDGVEIIQTYWRVFDDGFYRIESTVSNSDADNVYQLEADRLIDKAVFAYQFVALDIEGRAAVDTVYVHVSAFPVTVTANLESASVVEGDTFDLTIQLDSPLDQDVTFEYVLNNGSAVVGEDVEACSPCEIVIPEGETQIDVSLATLNDEVTEEDETFSVSFPGVPASFELTAVELTIVDTPDARPLLEVVQTNIVVSEQLDFIDIPVMIYSNGDEETGLPDDDSDVRRLPPAATTFSGTATLGEDYTVSNPNVILEITGGLTIVRIPIIDDVVSEADETIVVTFEDSELYRVGESNTATIRIQSNDIGAVAASRNSYCYVKDDIGLVCTDNNTGNPISTPQLGAVEKLVASTNYFCAIHLREDQQRRLDCWNSFSSESAIGEDAPEDIVALNSEVCLMTDGIILCERFIEGDFTGSRYERNAERLSGGYNSYCDFGVVDDSGFSNPIECRNVSDQVSGLLLQGAGQFQGYGNASEQLVSCAMSGNQLTCNEPLVDVLPRFSNPIDFALLNGSTRRNVLDAFFDLACVINTVEGSNELVCYESGEPVDLSELFTEGDVEIVSPYALTTDNQSIMCVAHLNGVACTRVQNLIPIPT